jgi:hypothetical protein
VVLVFLEAGETWPIKASKSFWSKSPKKLLNFDLKSRHLKASKDFRLKSPKKPLNFDLKGWHLKASKDFK